MSEMPWKLTCPEVAGLTRGMLALLQAKEATMPESPKSVRELKRPWNKGKLIGAKPHLQPKHVWAIRTRLKLEGRPMTWPSSTPLWTSSKSEQRRVGKGCVRASHSQVWSELEKKQ